MIKISGYSDDIISIEGDINDEFDALATECDGYIACSDGTLIHYVYTNEGIWRLNVPVLGPNQIGLNKIEHKDDDDDNYSDIIEIYDNIKWVLHGIQIAKKGK